MANPQWKVGATQQTVSGPSRRYGFGFSIQDFRGAPLLTISYESEKEAKEAESTIREALETAIEVFKH
jgi:hypothetical protein